HRPEYGVTGNNFPIDWDPLLSSLNIVYSYVLWSLVNGPRNGRSVASPKWSLENEHSLVNGSPLLPNLYGTVSILGIIEKRRIVHSNPPASSEPSCFLFFPGSRRQLWLGGDVF